MAVVRIELLKGHGKEADIPRFLQKPVRQLSLTLHFNSASRGVVFRLRISPRIRSHIGTARKVVLGTHEEPIYAKTSENALHCHVPFISLLFFYETQNFAKRILKGAQV